MPLNKANLNTRAVIDEEKVYVFTPTETGEVLYLRDYMRYTTIIMMCTSYTGIVQLPSVSEAQGIQYTIRIDDASNAGSVRDADDSVDWEGDFAPDATDDYIILQSDGRKWNVVYNGIS